MMFRARVAPALAIALLLPSAAAEAATFVVTLNNASVDNWGEGLMSTEPLWTNGPRPIPGSQFYPSEIFGSNCDPVNRGNAAVLAAAYGLVTSGPNQNAWIIPPINAGGNFTQMITAPNPTPGNVKRLSFIATTIPTGGTNDDRDNIWIIHEYGNTHINETQADLYDPVTLLPKNTVTVGYRSYDMNSVNPNMAAGDCPGACPTNPASCFVAFRSVMPIDPPPRPTFQNFNQFVSPDNKTTDSLLLADVVVGTGSELVGTTNGGSYVNPPFGSGTGELEVLRQNNLTRATVPLTASDNHELLGFNMVDNFIGLPNPQEFVIADSNRIDPPMPGVPGKVQMLQYNVGTGTFNVVWTSSPYHYPGFWNMGPSAANVRTDIAGNEIVVADLGGHVAVLNAANGTTINSYDMFNTLAGEMVYGHATISNVDALAGNEITVVGGRTGAVFSFAAPAGMGNVPLTLVYQSEPRGRAFGNGPAIGNIDNDPNNEIVVVRGNMNEVRAYDVQHGTGCKHQWSTLSGHDYYWTSPVLGDVDGTSGREVIVFSNDGWMSVLRANAPVPGVCTEGTVVWEYQVSTGGNAWFTPVVGQVVGDAHLDVMLATYETFEAVDVNARRPEYRFSAQGARFYPSAVIQPGSGGLGTPGALIFLTGWANHTTYRLGTPNNSPVPVGWFNYQADTARTGAR